MPKNLTVIVFKPDSQSTDEFMVYVDPLQVGTNFMLQDYLVDLEPLYLVQQMERRR